MRTKEKTTIKDYLNKHMVEFESEDEKNNLEVSKLGGWEERAIIILLETIAVIWNKKDKRGIVTTGWFYVEITMKHLQFICKTRKAQDMENVTSIQIHQL